MQTMKWLLVCLVVAGGSCVSFAQMAKTDEHRTVSQIEDRLVGMTEGEFVPAADAMPEDKYSFAPTMIGAAILEEKPPVELGGENGPDSITTKADIVKFAKDSFAYLHKALSSINEKNQTDQIKSPFGEGKVTRLGIATIGLWHPFDHYGQMVVYLRMNGIVPQASR